MAESPRSGRFLDRVENLTLDQVGEASEAAFGNAAALLEEAAILRAHDRCARAYYLTEVACEELGKLPILFAVAVSVRLGIPVDWERTERRLLSHDEKVKQVLLMDALHVPGGPDESVKAFEKDIENLRLYLGMKNSTLYSFFMDGAFLEPNREVPCDHYDTLAGLAAKRLRAFESLYIMPVRSAGSLEAFLGGQWGIGDVLEWLAGEEGRSAYVRYQETGDATALRGLFNDLFRRGDSSEG